jgi:predicted nucleic acid-binding protein
LNDGVLDAGIIIGWLQRRPRSLAKVDALLDSCRARSTRLFLSVVNLAEVLAHMSDWRKATGADPLHVVRAYGVEIHKPDEAVAARVAMLRTSIADGFAAATALELGCRLYTTDRDLQAQLRSARLAVTYW